MSDDDPVRAWLDDLGDSDDPAEAIHLAIDHAPALLSTPGIASALISDREGDAARRLLLFAALVEQARPNMENRGRLPAPPSYGVTPTSADLFLFANTGAFQSAGCTQPAD